MSLSIQGIPELVSPAIRIIHEVRYIPEFMSPNVLAYSLVHVSESAVVDFFEWSWKVY